MLNDDNLAFCTNRQVNHEFCHIFVTESITDGNAVSLATRERTYVFPLYLYPTNQPSLTQKPLMDQRTQLQT